MHPHAVSQNDTCHKMSQLFKRMIFWYVFCICHPCSILSAAITITTITSFVFFRSLMRIFHENLFLLLLNSSKYFHFITMYLSIHVNAFPVSHINKVWWNFLRDMRKALQLHKKAATTIAAVVTSCNCHASFLSLVESFASNST